MTQQATITDELAFSQPYGEQEKQILTPEAVEFLTELVSRFTPARTSCWPRVCSNSRLLTTGSFRILFRKLLPLEMATGLFAVSRLICRIAAWKSPAPSSARWSLTR